jgi:hypothetical protein
MIQRTAKANTWSAKKKKIAMITAIIKTIKVVIRVSFRVGKVTFEASFRTSRMNSPGDVLAMLQLTCSAERP